MGGKGLGKYLNFNFISTRFDLEQFCYLENCETLPKTHENLLTKDEKGAVNILKTLASLSKVNIKSVCCGKRIIPFCHITEI